MVGRVLRARHRGRNQRELWDHEISHEASYWREFLTSHRDDVRWRSDPSSRVPAHGLLYEVLQRTPSDHVTILDVGAGPLTPLGHVFPGKRLAITAVDPLADQYDALLAEAGIVPPVRTIVGDGERLLEQFAPETFDVASSQNALDHSYDPIRAIEAMLAVVRPGGWVLLDHRANEAEHQLYRGLHQWNFDCRDGRLLLWSPDEQHDITEVLSESATTSCRLEDNRVRAIIEKRPS